jgi:serpin B
MAAGGVRFAIDLYAHLRTQPGNLVCSPLGVSAAFGMVAAAADGRTRAEVLRAFHFPQEPARLHVPLGALLRSLEKAAGEGGHELELARRLWVRKGEPVREAFLKSCHRHYGAEAAPADFHGDAERARREINAWLSERSRGRAPELLLPGSVGPLTSLVLGASAWFRGRWEEPFPSGDTTVEPFRCSRAAGCSVPTMHAVRDVPHFRGEGLAAVELPFAGGRLALLLALPDEVEGLGTLEGRWSAAALERVAAGLAPRPVELAVPRFAFVARFALRHALGLLGVRGAFHAGRADFSHLGGGEGLALEDCWHAGHVSVDEAGAEAAAVGAAAVSADIRAEPARFRADHPFLFLIRDRPSGTVLFMGRVADPSKS